MKQECAILRPLSRADTHSFSSQIVPCERESQSDRIRMQKFQTENHQQSPASITRFEEGREGMRQRLRGGGGGGEGKVEGRREGGVVADLEILIINEILEMRDYQGEINH